jgi:tRNA(Ile)-lysidine synthase
VQANHEAKQHAREYNEGMIIEKMRQTINDACPLLPGARILVGVSGGPDSLTLLDGLHQLGYEVIAAHYNHGLRPQAAEDARHVEAIAQHMGVRFILDGSDIAAHASANRMSIEEAARTLRYRFLFDQARRLNCVAVAVGHTADDQVETVLMHFLRGTGLAGLRGMLPCAVMPAWDDHILLLRPLLSVWRVEITAYCSDRSLQPVFDLSNLDTTFYRNRLRQELIPYLQEYNPQVKEVIWRLSHTAAADYELLVDLTQEAWQRSLLSEGLDYVVLSLSQLRGMQAGLLRNVLRKAVGQLRPGLRDIDFSAIERAGGFVHAPPKTRTMDLVAGLHLYVSGDRIFLADQHSPLLLEEWPQLAPGKMHELPVPGRLELSNGWILASQAVDASGIQLEDDPYQAWLDESCLSLPLQVRTRQPGDRFRPLGMEGHSLKLSDFWINEGLPRPARVGWPLVCSQGEIVWIPGFRPAETCRLQQDTRRAVHLFLKRKATIN